MLGWAISARRMILLSVVVTIAIVITLWASGVFQSGPQFQFFLQQF